MAPKITKISSFSHSDIVLGEPKKNNGKYEMKFENDLIIQTCKLNVSKITEKYIEFSIPKGKKGTQFYNFLTSLDKHLIKLISENSQIWFNKFIPLECAEEM